MKAGRPVLIVPKTVTSFTPKRIMIAWKVAVALARVWPEVRPAEVTVIDALLRAIEDENIDLIVAGAYGHSRLGEWVFGGVTRELLAESPICCLLSH